MRAFVQMREMLSTQGMRERTFEFSLSARAGDHRSIERPRASDFDLSDFDLGIELRPALQ
jgi:hypothetical protein